MTHDRYCKFCLCVRPVSVAFPLQKLLSRNSMKRLMSTLIALSCTSLCFDDHVSAFAPSMKTRRYHPKLHRSGRDEDEDINSRITPESTAGNDSTSIMQRFLSPKIDDPGLPLTDVLLAQIVAPSFQTFWISALHAPSPSWLRPLGSYFGEAPELAPRGSLLAPTLIHGAGLAVCWGLGALASQFYERQSFTVKESGNILERYGTVCKNSIVFFYPF